MYKLYYLPDACSLATQVVLRELGQAVEIIDKRNVDNFNTINPVGSVPVLVENGGIRREGAAILIHLLDTHENDMLPTSGEQRTQAIQNILFANATMHPAYGRLFFIAQNIADPKAQKSAYQAAETAITQLWAVVEQQLEAQSFLGGDRPSAADIMLTVYSRWGGNFPVNIEIGPLASQMIEAVLAMPNFQRSIEAERQEAAA